MSQPALQVKRFAQLRDVEVSFGDLTVLVGPQATGKSLLLQLLKLSLDSGQISRTLKNRGFGWRNRAEFCAVYFGEGMSNAWSDDSLVRFAGKSLQAPPRKATAGVSKLFYIPAHRTLSVAEGWPLGFRSYKPDTPYIVREFSEQLLQLLTTRGGLESDVVFPKTRRLKEPFRKLVDEAVFRGGRLELLSDGPRRQFKLVYPHADIAYMAWTAGQREFIPLLLGIYHLVPLGAKSKAEGLEWVVIEEPEMGLHPKAIQAVMLLILELMGRGYRVAISTHSPSILEVVWAIRELQAKHASARSLRKVFDLEKARWDVDALAQEALGKRYSVFYLDYGPDGVVSRDISGLDPGAVDIRERTWGDLVGLSVRANEAVAEAD
jgi:hypothetical protein